MVKNFGEVMIQSPKDFQSLDDELIRHSMVERFEQVVIDQPSHIAVSADGKKTTYHELNQIANRIAHAILARIEPCSELVGLVLGHNHHVIQAIWGVLKSGNAYVVLLPWLPSARLTQMLEDMGTHLVITDNQNFLTAKSSLPLSSRIELLNLDEMEEVLPCENPGLSIPPESMAYVIYTSGSTGAPKGVIHLHQNVLNTTLGQINELFISSSDRLAMYLTLGFDAARFCLFGAPLSGATLCLFDTRSKGVTGLPEWIAKEGISILHATPSTFRHILAMFPEKKLFSHVRLVNLGGEPVNSYDVQLFRKHFGKKCVLCNSLGSTETQTATRFLIDRQTPLVGTLVPVGYPLKGKTIEIVNEVSIPVEVGEIGEILVKSRYLSPGYWRRPDLTTEKFSRDQNDGTLRIFHTGDLGRMKPGGCLEHLGRSDSQVKIRGMRVELSEIEGLLLLQPGVRNAAVIAREISRSPLDEKQILAYIETKEKPSLSRMLIMEALADQLPDFMLPSTIIILDKLPLTPTGKVDSLQLPDPEAANPDQDRIHLQARDAVEKQLVNIWESVLKTKPIGVQDNYFELGGTSLNAAQLFSQVEKTFRKKLPLAILFQAPTIEKQAAILRQEDWVPDWSALVAMKSRGSKPPLFLAAPVGGNVLTYHDLILQLPDDQPCYGLQALGLDGVQLPHHDVKDIAAHNIREMETVQSDGPYYLGGSSFGGLVVYEMAQQLQDQGKPVALVVMFDTHGPNYPKRTGRKSRLRRRVYKILRQTEMHLNNLQCAEGGAKWEYLEKKGRKFFTRFSRRVRNKTDRLLHPLPEELKKVHAASFQAGSKEDRKQRGKRRFGGRLVLFRASKQPLGIVPNPNLGWDTLVGENIEVYEIPGHHTSIIHEPRVNILADKLQEILDETQIGV